MAAPPLSKQEALRRKRAIEDALRAGYPPPGVSAGGKKAAVGAAAAAMGAPVGSRGAFLSSLKSAGFEPDWSLYRPAANPDADIDPIQKRGIVDALGASKRRIAELERLNAQLADVRDFAFGLKDRDLPPPWLASPPSKKAASAQIAMLVLSDEQVGEVVKPEDIQYPNSYNIAVYRKRIRAVIENAISTTLKHDGGVPLLGLVLALLGDAISGDIHEDLQRSQPTSPMQQAEIWGDEIIRALTRLLEARRPDGTFLYPEIYVVFRGGNHDRSTERVLTKNALAYTITYSAYSRVEWVFRERKEKRVKFYCPQGADAVVRIFNQNILLTHGDRIGSRGSGGHIGPEANIIKGAIKVIRQAHAKGVHISCVVMGHWHISRDLGRAIVNGSLVGFSEYAANELRVEPEQPSQTLLFFHRERGMISRRPVFCEDPPPVKVGKPVQFLDLSEAA